MKRNALLLMGFFMAIVVAVVFVACGGGSKSGNNASGSDVAVYKASGPSAKIVGKWKCNESYYGEAMVVVFKSDNTGTIKTSGYYGTETASLSYNYDDDFDELKLAISDDYYGYYGYYYGYGYDGFTTMKVEWFGDDRFYLVDKYYGYYKIGPFVRQ